MKKVILLLTVIILILGSKDSAIGKLIDNGDGTITDTAKGIMWLQDANYVLTSGYLYSIKTEYNDGRMNWFQASEWADQLTFAGLSDWRLPSSKNLGVTCTDPSNMYFDCNDTELGHLYFDEADNLSIFNNVQQYQYWSGTIYSEDPFGVYYINFASGYQGVNGYSFNSYAWAVRDVSVVPEPISFILFITGGTLLAVRHFFNMNS